MRRRWSADSDLSRPASIHTSIRWCVRSCREEPGDRRGDLQEFALRRPSQFDPHVNDSAGPQVRVEGHLDRGLSAVDELLQQRRPGAGSQSPARSQCLSTTADPLAAKSGELAVEVAWREGRKSVGGEAARLGPLAAQPT